VNGVMRGTRAGAGTRIVGMTVYWVNTFTAIHDEERTRQGPWDNRRRFLSASLMVGGAAFVLGGAGRLNIARRFGAAEASRDALTIPVPADPLPPVAAGAVIDTPGISPFITPNADFYRVDTAFIVPRVDTDSWRLTIHGMVDREMELTFEQLMSREVIERDITIACVSNEVGGPYIGNARWIGVPLKPLLEEAGVHADADQIVSRSVDGFTVGTPTAVAVDPSGRFVTTANFARKIRRLRRETSTQQAMQCGVLQENDRFRVLDFSARNHCQRLRKRDFKDLNLFILDTSASGDLFVCRIFSREKMEHLSH